MRRNVPGQPGSIRKFLLVQKESKRDKRIRRNVHQSKSAAVVVGIIWTGLFFDHLKSERGFFSSDSRFCNCVVIVGWRWNRRSSPISGQVIH